MGRKLPMTGEDIMDHCTNVLIADSAEEFCAALSASYSGPAVFRFAEQRAMESRQSGKSWKRNRTFWFWI